MFVFLQIKLFVSIQIQMQNFQIRMPINNKHKIIKEIPASLTLLVSPV
jgi:hypothetical protein